MAVEHSMYQLVDILVGCIFWLAPILLWVKVLHVRIFISLGCLYSRSGIARSNAKSIFKLFKNCQALCQYAATILHSHKQFIRILISTHPHQQSTCYCMIFDCNLHPSGCEVVSPCDFGLHFPDD